MLSKTTLVTLTWVLLTFCPAHAEDSVYLVHDPLREGAVAQKLAKDARLVPYAKTVRGIEDGLANRSVRSLQELLGQGTTRTVGLFALPIATRRERTLKIPSQEGRHKDIFLRIGDIGGVHLSFVDAQHEPYLLVLYLRVTADFWPASVDDVEKRLAWEKRQLAAIESALENGPIRRPLLQRYTGKIEMPDTLYLTYQRLVDGMRVGNEQLIKSEMLADAVHVSRHERPTKSRERGDAINVLFARDGFTPHILDIRHELDDVVLIRTGSSYLRFVHTRSGTWKLFVYGDKPIR